MDNVIKTKALELLAQNRDLRELVRTQDEIITILKSQRVTSTRLIDNLEKIVTNQDEIIKKVLPS